MPHFFHQYLICIATVKSLQSSRLFRTILWNYYFLSAVVNPRRKITCENSGAQTTRNNILRHKKSCPSGTLFCTHCPNFSRKPQSDLKYHIAKKQSASKPEVTFKCELCYQEFPGFYALRKHRNTQHGMQIGSGTRDVDVDVVHMVGVVEDHKLREELRSCQHFLVESELERARHKVFNYAVETQRNNREQET